MKFPIWLIPIIAMTIIITVMGSKQKSWSELSPQEKSQRKIFIIIGIILCVMGIIAFFIFNNRF